MPRFGICSTVLPTHWLCNVRLGIRILPSTFVSETALKNQDFRLSRGISVQLYNTVDDAKRVLANWPEDAKKRVKIMPFTLDLDNAAT